MNDPNGSTATASFVDLPAPVDDEQLRRLHQRHPPGVRSRLPARRDERSSSRERSLPESQDDEVQFVRAALGIAGTYSKHDSIDITYEHDGRKLVITGLRPRSSE